MKVKIQLVARNNNYRATAIYENGKISIEKGSKLRVSCSSHFRCSKIIKKYREDPTFVNEDGVIIKKCEFSTPSAAAQFIMGSSVNGWTAWHVDKNTNLKQYVESHKEESCENNQQ